MNISTATNRLRKDVLFSLAVQAGHKCFQCGGDMSRDDFTLEHKRPWLHEKNAIDLFFDLNNVAFSHSACNSSASRKPNKIYENDAERARAAYKRRVYRDPERVRERRRNKYLRTGT